MYEIAGSVAEARAALHLRLVDCQRSEAEEEVEVLTSQPSTIEQVMVKVSDSQVEAASGVFDCLSGLWVITKDWIAREREPWSVTTSLLTCYDLDRYLYGKSQSLSHQLLKKFADGCYGLEREKRGKS